MDEGGLDVIKPIVILSIAKNLIRLAFRLNKILRFAQDDKLEKGHYLEASGRCYHQQTRYVISSIARNDIAVKRVLFHVNVKQMKQVK